MTSSFELDWCEHTERRMATLAVVKGLEVLKHRVSELNASAPSFSVEQLDLHPTPKGLHHGVVETVADRAHRWQKSRVDGSTSECPGSELPRFKASSQQWPGEWSLGVRRGLRQAFSSPASFGVVH